MSGLAGEVERDRDALLGEPALRAYLGEQRWFGGKTRELTAVRLFDDAILRSEEPTLMLALGEASYESGAHDVYQFLVAMRRLATGVSGEKTSGENRPPGVISQARGVLSYDGLAEPQLAHELLRLARTGASIDSSSRGSIEFHANDGLAKAAAGAVQTGTLEQSNSSLVVDDTFFIKAYRQLEAGTNPELELLAYLTSHGFPHTPELVGWWDYSGPQLAATLGIVQRYLPGAVDGWTLALAQIPRAPETFLSTLRGLGEVVATLHTTLASDHDDPAFCPEQPSAETLHLLTATIDEEIAQLFLHLPACTELGPLAGRESELRDLLQRLTNIGSLGRLIRPHGDLHLGQALLVDGNWFLIDFEGEPARTLIERRRKRSPLRDVAGMLRSFAYATSALELRGDLKVPAGFAAHARARFLDAYLHAAQPAGLLPDDPEAITRLLKLFELEKAVYELRYELDNRPDWVAVPVAALCRLLEESA